MCRACIYMRTGIRVSRSARKWMHFCISLCDSIHMNHPGVSQVAQTPQRLDDEQPTSTKKNSLFFGGFFPPSFFLPHPPHAFAHGPFRILPHPLLLLVPLLSPSFFSLHTHTLSPPWRHLSSPPARGRGGGGGLWLTGYRLESGDSHKDATGDGRGR
jgi:hypothetical protein